ncbi:MAG: hypothetical protein GC172_00350 [Phycisphaera sp.]|nr:hypothetical protein [Phycisphaera sp.]
MNFAAFSTAFSTRSTLVALALLATATPAAPCGLRTATAFPQAQSDAPSAPPSALPDGTELLRRALDRLGGDAWNAIGSFESVARVETPMGKGRVAYSFVAPVAKLPAAHLLVQTMPGGDGTASGAETTLELGVADGVAWMGEPGRAQPVEPAMAAELAGGGDLITLVRSLSARFSDVRTIGRETVDGRPCWRLAMRPVGAPPEHAPWSLFLSEPDAEIVGLEIPPPPRAEAANAPVAGGQSMRFRRWEPVERGNRALAPASEDTPARLVSFREATITTAGMKIDMIYERVAVDTLAPGSIAAPASIGGGAARGR